MQAFLFPSPAPSSAPYPGPTCARPETWTPTNSLPSTLTARPPANPGGHSTQERRSRPLPPTLNSGDQGPAEPSQNRGVRGRILPHLTPPRKGEAAQVPLQTGPEERGRGGPSGEGSGSWGSPGGHRPSQGRPEAPAAERKKSTSPFPLRASSGLWAPRRSRPEGRAAREQIGERLT